MKLAVIGSPIAHSLSPELHGYWLKKYAINASYEALDISPHSLPDFLKTMLENGFLGCNITIPHKEAALQYVDEVDEIARLMGATNTISVKDGKLLATNTDAYGFVTSLTKHQVKLSGKKALVIGAGGAARAICAGLLQENTAIILANRNQARAEALASHLGHQNITVIAMEEIVSHLEQTDILINTTSLGMQHHPELILDLTTLPREASVTDIVYKPLETPLLKQAKARGNRTIDGLNMLLYQAQKAFFIWFGIEPVVDEELRTCLESFLTMDF